MKRVNDTIRRRRRRKRRKRNKRRRTSKRREPRLQLTWERLHFVIFDVGFLLHLVNTIIR